jgi:hypothetical protein
MLGLELIALAFSFVEMVDQIDPTLRQRPKRDVLVLEPGEFAYPAQD